MKKIRLLFLTISLIGFCLSTFPVNAGCVQYVILSKYGTGQNAGACLVGGDECKVEYTLCGPDF